MAAAVTGLERHAAGDARNQLIRMLQASEHIKESRDYFAPRDVRAAGLVTPLEAWELRAYSALKERAREAVEKQRRIGAQR
jgi:hypothetical protein